MTEDKALTRPPIAPGARRSVAVVIPSFNMEWCIERALASCLSQTHPPAEIIVVDDGSTDGTSHLMRGLMLNEPRIRYERLSENQGHLPALLRGMSCSTMDWTALLDADDELTEDSLERRVAAAEEYHASSGEWPQLVYGDLYWERIAPGALCRFKRIHGRDLRFLFRELSLCQTSTIMLGREVLLWFPEIENPYNSDDEIVLTAASHSPITHCGAPVAVTHAYESDASSSPHNARRRLRGIAKLVRDHRHDIMREHGARRFLLWRLRVLRAFLEWQSGWARQQPQAKCFFMSLRWAFRLYARLTNGLHSCLTVFLEKHFEQMYF